MPSFNKVRTMVLTGSDHPHLIKPNPPVRSGAIGDPVAVCRLRHWDGWCRDQPVSYNSTLVRISDFTCLPLEELQQHVERLWLTDTLPFRSLKEATRSREDKEALALLEQKSNRVMVDGGSRYAVSLLHRRNSPLLNTSQNAVMLLLRATGGRLSHNPEQLVVYKRGNP